MSPEDIALIVLGVIIIFILIIIVHCTVAFRRAKRSLAKAIHQQQQQSPPQPQLQTHHLSHLQQNLQIQQVMDFTTGASSSTPKFVAAVADLSNRSTHSPPSLSPQISVILVKEEDSSHHHMNLSRHWASDWSGMDRGFDESTDSLHSPTSHDNSSSPSQSTIRPPKRAASLQLLNALNVNPAGSTPLSSGDSLVSFSRKYYEESSIYSSIHNTDEGSGRSHRSVSMEEEGVRQDSLSRPLSLFRLDSLMGTIQRYVEEQHPSQ